MRFIDQDVIIVSPNYRLGSLGFTSLGIDEAPGNQVKFFFGIVLTFFRLKIC